MNSLLRTDGGAGSGEQGKRRAEDEEDSAQHTQQKVCRGEIVSNNDFIQQTYFAKYLPPIYLKNKKIVCQGDDRVQQNPNGLQRTMQVENTTATRNK